MEVTNWAIAGVVLLTIVIPVIGLIAVALVAFYFSEKRDALMRHFGKFDE